MWSEQVLIDTGCSPDVVAHCRAVSLAAEALAARVLAAPVDVDLVRQGGLLHDIGRSRTQGIGHALAGVEIGRGLGFSPALLNIIERHIGAGITAGEAERLGLPRRDYLPITVEEKIVSYADNLTKGSTPMSFEAALRRFTEILGHDHEGIELFRRQHDEVQSWMR
ncbi:MAG: HDIG domain-containing protein [Nitrospirota bacterium]|nr:HDIG domain-containing protein [Nitrospirota bacterium]